MGLRPNRPLAVLAGMWLVLAVTAPTFAHADLASSDPEDKAVLAMPPTVITLTFTEGLDQGKSSFKLSGPDGAVGTGKPAVDGSMVMTLDGLDLGPGAYTVKWTAAATDGHVERGMLSFTVSEPTLPPATPAPTPAGAPTEPASAVPTTAPSTPGPSADGAGLVASPVATGGAGTDPAAASGSGTDVLIPIVVGLLLVAGIGALVLRRGRGV